MIYELEHRILFDGAVAVQTAEAVIAEMNVVNSTDSVDSSNPNPDSLTTINDSSSSQSEVGNSQSEIDTTQIFIDSIVGTSDLVTNGENLLETPR